MKRARDLRWFWFSLAIAVADRATKFAIEQSTTTDFRQVIVPGLVTLVHSNNPGIAFGMLADSPSPGLEAALMAGSAAVICLLVWLLATGRAAGARNHAGLALILGGAAGNLLDRILHGNVTDFFEVHAGRFHWPAFNLADAAITIGALLVMIELLDIRSHSSGHASENKT